MISKKFGYHEVIHPYDTALVTGEKTTFNFGVPKSRIVKESESIAVGDDKDAITEFIKALQGVKSQKDRYLCFEVFTDESPSHKIHRINVCTLGDGAV